jgi:hypothetical protein
VSTAAAADKALLTDDQILMIIDNGIQFDAGDLLEHQDRRRFDGQDYITDPTSGAAIANHRKVAFYGTTAQFSGTGDLLGCDGSTTSGVTHGHTVAAIALGNASRVPLSYGATVRRHRRRPQLLGSRRTGSEGELIAYDGQVTPLTGRCDDVTQIVGSSPLDVGDLYTAPSSGSLPTAYAKGAVSPTSRGAPSRTAPTIATPRRSTASWPPTAMPWFSSPPATPVATRTPTAFRTRIPSALRNRKEHHLRGCIA